MNRDRFHDPDGIRDPTAAGEADDWWEEAYASDDSVPWDVGEPQPAVRSLVADDAVTSPVLDVGCGLGTHARFLADAGYDVTGVDASRTAIEDARAAAIDDDVDVTFEVGDALALGSNTGVVDEDAARTVLDVGMFHVFEAERDAYVDALARVLERGGRAFVLSFAPGAPDDWGPTLVSRADVREAFGGPEWSVVDIEDGEFVTLSGPVPALLSTVERTEA